MAVYFKNNFQIFKLCVKNFSKPLRYLSSTLIQNVRNSSSIQLWSQEVNNFGDLNVFNGNFDVHIKGSNLWHGEKSIVRVSLMSDELEDSEKDFKVLTEKGCFKVANKQDGFSQVTIQTDDKKMPEDFKLHLLTRTAKLLIEIPYTYELYLSSSGSKAIVVVENIESDNIDIHTENNCFLSQLKSQSISVTSKTGDILSDSSLVGNLALSTSRDGCVRLKKAQGNDLKINCEEGCVDVSSLYGGDVVVNTQAGNITMGDAHGNIEMNSTAGDIICGSVSGLLKALTKDGDIGAKLTLGGNINATSLNGNAVIKLDSDLKCQLELTSKTMSVASGLIIMDEKSEQISHGLRTFTGQTHGAGEQCTRVKCEKGNIDILQENWFVLPES